VLYTPYPETWPTYTPKDKLADWLEAYARMHDLLVWTGVELTPDSALTYDESAHRWTLTVVRNGARVVLHPAHVVLATGTLGAPHTPAVPDAAVFKGTVLHSSAYTHAAPFAGQRVLVVGAANTAADVCADLVGAHARVTMLQRSPTAVAFQNALRAYWTANFPPGVPHALADFKLFAVPNALREDRVHAWRAAALADGRDPDVFGDEDARAKAGMRAHGFLFGDGSDGLGAAGEINARFAGYRACARTA
jgi:cation diffusion facilitator CzcD-associated flavoprotein CzcO